MKKQLILLLALTLIASLLVAETVEEKLQKFGQENAKGFIQPFVNSFGNNLNSGFYNTAKVLKPLRFQFSLNLTASTIPSSDKTFMVQNPFLNDPFNPYIETEIETATIFGKDGGEFTSNYPEFAPFAMPGGLDLKMMPFAVPQVSVGLPLGNEILVRYFPKMEINEDIGIYILWFRLKT